MSQRKILDKLEHDLSHFIIAEITKTDPSKKGSPELYKYKGLNITPNRKAKGDEKVVAVRIGALEAQFKINSCEKCSGFLNPDEERLIKIWLALNDTNAHMKTLFVNRVVKRTIPIVPFDLEEFYSC